MSPDCTYVTVKVKISHGWAGPYTYCCPFDDVQVADAVIVPFGAENNLKFGVVQEVNPPLTIKQLATKWVAAHVNHRAHDMRMVMGVPVLKKGD